MPPRTLTFHRRLPEILRDMERCSVPNEYDALLGEWVDHPEAVVMQARAEAVDKLLDQQLEGAPAWVGAL